MSRRTNRGLAWEVGLVLLLIGGFYLLAASGALAELGRLLGEYMAQNIGTRTPSP